MSEARGHVIVVGAGMFGTAAALELRTRGWRVSVLDPGPIPNPAASSTDVSKLVRMDYGSDVFHHEFVEAALLGWDRWNADWPEKVYHEDGILILSRGVMEPGGFEYESWRVQLERGYELERIDGSWLSQHYPSWNPDAYADGYVSRRAGWAESGSVVRQLVANGERAGVRYLRSACTTVLDRGSEVTGVTTADGDIAADRVLVCAGAWTPVLLPELRSLIRTTGQPVLHFGVADPDSFRGNLFIPWAADIANSGWYGFPALDDGRLKIGHHGPGLPVHPGRPGSVPESHRAHARAFLRDALPGLAEAPLTDQRMCLYCDTIDGDFLVDHHPDRDGLVVATGGSGHGFKFAPLMGPLIADVLERRDNRWAERYRWRAGDPVHNEAARFTGA